MEADLKVQRLLSRIRLLCSTAIPSEQVIPELLEALHLLVPAVGYNFAWLTPTGQTTGMYCEPPLRASMEVFRDEGPTLMAAAGYKPESLTDRSCRSFGSLELTGRPAFRDTQMYAAMCEPCQVAHGWDGLIRVEGELVAALVLWRSGRDPVVCPEEEDVLQLTLRHFSHLLATQAADRPAAILAEDPERIGWLVVSPTAVIQHVSPQARDMLGEMAHPVFCRAHSTACEDRLQVDEAIRSLVQDLCAPSGLGRRRSIDGIDHAPPRRTLRAPWGWYVLRAVWLSPVGDGCLPHIGIQITRRVPQLLLALRRMEQLPLSVKQKELCLSLLNHLKADEIEARHGIKATTQKDYLKRIYDKLGVNSREALFRVLLSPH